MSEPGNAVVSVNASLFMASVIGTVLYFAWPDQQSDWRYHLMIWFGVLICGAYLISGVGGMIKNWLHREKIRKARRLDGSHGTARWSDLRDLDNF